MHKSTKSHQFSNDTIRKIFERDHGCLFCRMRYHIENPSSIEYCMTDPMHIVNKSQGGLGIVENGLQGCRYHHHLLDNGNKGLREEMQNIITKYMTEIYPGWDRKDLIYKK